MERRMSSGGRISWANPVHRNKKDEPPLLEEEEEEGGGIGIGE
jgi:hypothetical protein